MSIAERGETGINLIPALFVVYLLITRRFRQASVAALLVSPISWDHQWC